MADVKNPLSLDTICSRTIRGWARSLEDVFVYRKHQTKPSCPMWSLKRAHATQLCKPTRRCIRVHVCFQRSWRRSSRQRQHKQEDIIYNGYQDSGQTRQTTSRAVGAARLHSVGSRERRERQIYEVNHHRGVSLPLCGQQKCVISTLPRPEPSTILNHAVPSGSQVANIKDLSVPSILQLVEMD